MKLYAGGICLGTFCCLCLPGLFAQSAPDQLADALQPGVVVEQIAKNSEAEKAAIKKGDILLRWRRGDAQGEIRSPFDLASIEIEQAPRGAVVLEGLRGTDARIWALEPDSWGIQARPNFSEALLVAYDGGQKLATAGKLSEAAERWRAISSQSSSAPWLDSWLFFHAGQLHTEARQWKEADEAYQEAFQKGEHAEAEVQAQVLRAWGKVFEQRSIWVEAEKYYQQAVGKDASAGSNLGRAVDLDNLGNAARARNDFTRAEDCYLQGLRVREKFAPGSLAVASSLNKLGSLEDDRGVLAKAEDYYRQALAIGEKQGAGRLGVSTSLRGLGDVAYDRGDLVRADVYYAQALEIKERLAPGSLDVASTLNNLGNVAYRRGDLTRAEDYYRRSLEVKEKLAPGSLKVASTLANLGNVAHDRGDLVRAEEYYRRDLEITAKIAPGSLDFAGSLMDLGIVVQARGDLTRAEEYYRQALEIKERLAPGSLDLAYTLNNLGSVALDQQDLVQAEEYFRQTLEIRKKLAPDSLDIAHVLTNLGEVALDRDDLVRAEEYNRQALQITERLAPGSLDVANTLDLLGIVYWKRRDFASTERYCRRALGIREKVAPGSPDVARSLDNLGAVAWRRGDLPKAEEYLQRALAIREKIVPDSVETAGGLNRLSAVVKDRGDLNKAEQYYRRALSIWENLAPASANAAESLAGLASILRRRGQLDAAAQFYERALTALEGQTARLGGAEEVRAGFRAEHEDCYREYIDLLVSQGKLALAFGVLERSRARTLLETLAEGRIDVRQGVDPQLIAKERSLRADLRAKADRRIHLLTDKHSDEQTKVVEKEISNLTREYQDVEAQIRSTSPVYAALTQPQPLSAREIQEQFLDSDTVLLEYALGEERSHAFVVSDHGLQVLELPKRTTIEVAARRVYNLLTARNRRKKNETYFERATRIARAEAEYPQAAARLSEIVLGPVTKQLTGKRLLIVSDGALHYIPFAALHVSVPGKPALPLVAEHEIINLPSASVLAVLRQEGIGRQRAEKTVAILADPVFDNGDIRVNHAGEQRARRDAPRGTYEMPEKQERAAQPLSLAGLTRSAADVGWKQQQNGGVYLPRLPFSRREADQIAATAPRGQSFEALDFKASRATITNPNLAHYQIVHLATHALVNNKHPELSGLVLSLVDEQGRPQDGFLDLRDIYNLNLPVDLVVLSGCETALGKGIEGEGLVGLTRGFMYAGASRVMASLWNIDDRATAELMHHFYRAMVGQGMKPAAALRSAQLQMLKQERWNSPYFWAAFQIQGELK